MIDRETGMFEYLYLPYSNSFIRENVPIRDIATIWDVEMLEKFLNKHEWRSVTENAVKYYAAYLVEREGCLILDTRRLGEPSSIAHSAFMILTLLEARPEPQRHRQITALAEGIRRQQRPDGSYQVYFSDLPDSGAELYAGEAMLALLMAYRDSPDRRLLHSAERGFSYYSQVFENQGVEADMLVFFANWQSQACRVLYECSQDGEVKKSVANFIIQMHDAIIERGFYDNIDAFPSRQSTVEVACALEGINDAFAVAKETTEERMVRYRHCICTGLRYLIRIQSTREAPEKEHGGFGMSLDEPAQRMDITGHAASAFMKGIENGIECSNSSASDREE